MLKLNGPIETKFFTKIPANTANNSAKNLRKELPYSFSG